MNTDDDGPTKKKIDKTAAENITVILDKSDAKKPEKGDVDPKPRIVLTFRSEKSSAKSSNMKIVSNEEKLEEFSPRRSSRTKGKWDWVCDSDTSTSPKKDKSQPMSENDESDSSHTAPKRTRRRSKDSSDNIIANTIVRKEKCYNETPAGPTQRLSRRIKPTPKILANEELRIGLESQNNARLGIQTDKSPEEGVRTRRSARPAADKLKAVDKVTDEDAEVVELGTDEDSQSQNSVMKLKHLCELGLKAINPDEDDENKEMDENEADVVEDEEIDDDSEVISKLLEADEDTGSDEDFYCSVEASPSNQPRRSTRLCSSYGMNDSDRSSPIPDDEQKAPPRRSSRRTATHSFIDDSDRSYRSKRKRIRSPAADEVHSEIEHEEKSNPAGGDEGSEAACPAEESAVVATCFCETPSNVHAAPTELTEPVFCQAIESVDGVRVGCSHGARRPGGELAALVRAGPRAPYFLACALHATQLAAHMCCPTCGLFCSQGIFYQCSDGHLFHLECGLPYNDGKLRPGCPHCGVYSYRWQPANRECCRVKVEMKCSNKRIFLPDQREQCTQAYLGFSTLSPKSLEGPIIPEDLLPSPPVDLSRLCERAQRQDQETSSPQELCDAILAGETVDQLIPKIVSGSSINAALPSQDGGTCVHAAASRGHLGAVYLLHYAGANLSATDGNMRTPLMLAALALLDKPEMRSKGKTKSTDRDAVDDMEDSNKSDQIEDKDSKTEDKEIESDKDKPKDEDLMKVIRYLVAAGCDVNYPDTEGLTALHMAAQYGGADVCSAILAAAGAEVDPRDHGGWTPLVWAAENSHARVVRLLLAAGADAASPDNEGNSAVHWCCLAGAAAALLQLLLSAPRQAAALNRHTDTPLHIAARQGHYSCVAILLARGARTDVENSAGELPVDVCTGQCQNAISLNMQMTFDVKDKSNRFRLLSSDISNGREWYPIPCVNEVDDAPAPHFTYVTRHVTPSPLQLDSTVQTMQGCECAAGAAGAAGEEGACTGDTCACCVLGVRRWTARGRLLPAFPFHDPPMLFECNQTCACNAKRCENSVVSRMVARGATQARAEVYRVGGGRGWGLRAGERVRRGAPVAAYCGELLALHHADTRADDQYMFALEVKPDLLEQCGDKTQLCVDAARYGSAARFINHSCRPNLAPVRVFTHTRDLRLPTVALFATADIPAGDQFTFDYGDKFWSVKSKWMKCECGSVDCRYPVKSTEETE